MLRATTACNCSSLIWPAGSAHAALASLLFDPPEPQIIGKYWKNTVFCDFPTFFTHLDLLSSEIFSSSLLFSDSSHLCFSSVHIVGSLTSKLPSILDLPTLKMIARWCHGPLGLPKLPKTSRCSKQIQTHSTQTLEILGSPCRRRTPMGSIAGRTSGTCDLSCSPQWTMSRVRPTKWCWTLEPMESPKRWKDEFSVTSDGKVWQVYSMQVWVPYVPCSFSDDPHSFEKKGKVNPCEPIDLTDLRTILKLP